MNNNESDSRVSLKVIMSKKAQVNNSLVFFQSFAIENISLDHTTRDATEMIQTKKTKRYRSEKKAEEKQYLN